MGPINDFPFDGPNEDAPSQFLVEGLPVIFDCMDVWSFYISEESRERWVDWTNKKAVDMKNMERPLVHLRALATSITCQMGACVVFRNECLPRNNDSQEPHRRCVETTILVKSLKVKHPFQI